MKKLEEFRKFFLLITIISLIFVSCNQPSNELEQENVTITVTHDSNIKKARTSFTLVKGSKLGFTALKEKIAPEFAKAYVISKIMLNDASGDEITNTAPYTFNTDTKIYISSRREGSGEKLELVELKVAGKSIEIADVMDAGKHKEDKVSLEAKAIPGDAVVEFDQNVKDGFLRLEVGKKNLKIKVKKGSDAKIYTLNIERTASDVPLLKKLTIDGKSKEAAQITEEMTFTVHKDATEVEVVAVTDQSGTSVTYNPTLTNEKLTLLGDETTLTITVGTAPKASIYTVKVRKLVPAGNLIDSLFIHGGQKRGSEEKISTEELDRILDGENITLEIAGPKVAILAGSKLKTWKAFKVNGVLFQSLPYQTYQSVTQADVKLPKKGEIMDVKIEVLDEKDVTELNFKIKRTDETVDVPIDRLLIREKNVLTSKMRLNLMDGSNPKLDGAEPSLIRVESGENVLKHIKINDTSYTMVVEKTDADNKPVWSIGGIVEGVNPSGKDVLLVIEPIDTYSYHAIALEFHLNYKVAEQMKVDYEINGKNVYNLPSTFVQGITKGTNPLIELDSKYLNIKLICKGQVKKINVNKEEISGDSLIVNDSDYILVKSIPIDLTEKQIDIEVIPEDLGVYSPIKYKFMAKGNSTIEKIEPTFQEISGDKNLPKATFLDKLTGSNKPLYKTVYETADIVIDLPSYAYDFLCKEVKINGEKVEINVIKDSLIYKIKRSISVSATSPTDVKIEFIANDEISQDLTWEFQVQGGGEKPSLPQSQVSIFKINGRGGEYEPLPEELAEHLIDGTNPVYTFDGKKILVEVGSYDDKLIEKVSFKLDSVQKHEGVPAKEGYAYLTKCEFKFDDTVSHDVEIIITPKDKKYSNLVYTFRLKWSGKKIPLPLIFSINGDVQKDGYVATLKAETAQLLVQAKNDVMLEVYIGEQSNEVQCEITTFKASGGGTIWQSEKYISLIDSSGNVVAKTFVIKVKPKDADIYEEATCKYTLKGTKLPTTNAEFVWTGGKYPSPKVLSKIDWIQGLNNRYSDDYGATAVTLTAYTLSVQAKVKYQIVDLEDKPIAGYAEKEMINEGGVHKSEKVDLFTDKPTRIKAWVVAADGNTIDNVKGLWKKTYNPVPLTWGYEDKTEGSDYTTKAYDLIEIVKGDVKDNKIYLVFVLLNGEDGYNVVNENLPEQQTDFVKMGALNNWKDYYKTTVDVSKLLDDSVPELNAILRMKKNGIDCLTYEIKIKVKQ